MKKISLIFIFFYFNFIYAQDSLPPAVCDKTPEKCKWDLKSVDLFPDITTVNRTYYKSSNINDIPGYNDPAYKAEGCSTIKSDACQDPTQLIYTVYYPTNNDYTTCTLPAIIMFHGGGFKDCSTLSAPDFVGICQGLARKGFVVFNVEYRRGVILDKSNTYYTVQQVLAIYRAGQDARGAVRSIVKRQMNEGIGGINDFYRIDLNRIFIGGASAGSVTAMNVAYYQKQSMIDAVFPNVKSILGNINVDYYYGDLGTPYKIQGVFNMWGAVPVPVNKLDDPSSFFATNSYFPPMIAFHGRKDLTFNIDYQAVTFAPPGTVHTPLDNISLNSTDQCLASSFALNPSSTGIDFYLLGSRKFYQTFKDNGYGAELYIDCDMGHGLNSNDPSKNDFGTHLTNITDVGEYLVERAATFFQAVMNSKATLLTTTKFKECENNRVKCLIASNPTTCPADNDPAQDIDCTVAD